MGSAASIAAFGATRDGQAMLAALDTAWKGLKELVKFGA